jgi:hypothetical protein
MYTPNEEGNRQTKTDALASYCIWKYTQLQYPEKYYPSNISQRSKLSPCLPCTGFRLGCEFYRSLDDLVSNAEVMYDYYYAGSQKRIIFDTKQIYRSNTYHS